MTMDGLLERVARFLEDEVDPGDRDELVSLSDRARAGDESAVKSQIAAVGKACGGCHDNFREKR